jgi:prepilin-type N-terminal cleavage/methylation domain-containing protein
MLVTKHSLRSQNAGFTLIELLVTTAITSIILLTASTILMTFFLSNSRTTIRRQIKAEGSRAQARIEFIVRGAQTCADIANGASFTYLDGTRYDIQSIGNNLRIIITEPSETPVTETLLSTFTTSTGTVTIDCVTATSSNKQYADIRFTLINAGNTITESFTTLTVLRNS